MNKQVLIDVTQLVIGAPLGGGFFAGLIDRNGERFAIIVAPKATGEHDATHWHDTYDDIEGAKSFNDGMANTNAMAEAGSNLAKWARELTLGGNDDWYLASQDEKEVCYRNLKPTNDENSGYARSGINLHSVPPSLPYTHQPAKQTEAEAFKAGGAEAFDDVGYWTSTQPAEDSSSAHGQTFDDGSQDNWLKGLKLRARAVRSIKVES